MSGFAKLQGKFERALEYGRAGRLAEAARLYRAILEKQPRSFDARYMLGLMLLQQGQWEAGERQLCLAVQIDPNVAGAHNNRGVALNELQRYDDALASYDRAIALQPDLAEAFDNRGNTLKRLGRFEDAVASYDRALALNPHSASTYNNRGVALQSLKRYDDALASYERALAIKPDFAEAFNNRGLTFKDVERFDLALASFDRALALRPGEPEAHNNRGLALLGLRRPQDALASFDKAIALKPDYADAYSNRANASIHLRRAGDALEDYNRAIALEPDFASARNNRGLCKLLTGDMAGGWPDYEWRWRVKDFTSVKPALDVPEWMGGEIEGRSILVYDEQGLGDVLQFCRYLPLLVRRGADVTFRVRAGLHRILKSLPEPVRLISTLDDSLSFDLQCALMSLPYRFGTERASIPAAAPYLAAEPERTAFWARKIGSGGFRIGVCWESKQSVLPGRSFPLAALHPLSRLPGVRLIGLQKGEALKQLAGLPSGMTIELPGEDFDAGPDAFIDTAAVMENLDLIVTCDTSVAHLAGTLGRPTWLALKCVPDWRWLLEGSASPWYPSMRLFRQERPEAWDQVFREMTEALAERLADR